MTKKGQAGGGFTVTCFIRVTHNLLMGEEIRAAVFLKMLISAAYCYSEESEETPKHSIAPWSEIQRLIFILFRLNVHCFVW